MFQLSGAYNARTRQLSLTDIAGGFSGLRRLVLVQGSSRSPVTESLPTATLTYTFSQDGVFQLVMQRVSALDVVVDESAVYTHIEDGSQKAAFADLYVRHAARPSLRGNDAAYRAAWLRCYAFLAAAAERNPARYRRLAETEVLPVPTTETRPYLNPATASPLGLPLAYAGVQWRVDNPEEGNITVLTRLTAVSKLTATVRKPDSPLPVTVTGVPGSGDTIAFTVEADKDGLYTFSLRAGRAPLTELVIPVLRGELISLREQVRGEQVALNDRFTRSREQHLPRLARLAATEAAARTGNKDVALALIDSLDRLERPVSPIHHYPLRNG